MAIRNIIFRGKRIDNGEWVFGSLIVWCDGSCSIETGRLNDAAPSVDPSTVGQYTGLTDKNGKQIFEGDIIRTKHGIRSIVFKDGCFGAQRYVAGIATLFANLNAYNRELNGNWKVIGNIHDNPELLKEENT